MPSKPGTITVTLTDDPWARARLRKRCTLRAWEGFSLSFSQKTLGVHHGRARLRCQKTLRAASRARARLRCQKTLRVVYGKTVFDVNLARAQHLRLS